MDSLVQNHRPLTDRLQDRLRDRERAGNLRSLRIANGVDFASNDYLGLAKSEPLKKRILQRLQEFQPDSGSTGSRLLTGNSARAQELEGTIATLFKSESALLFNSGYSLNTGLLALLSEPGDVILMDELAHASLKSGMKLSGARGFFFRHNNISHLKQKLERVASHCSGQIFIVVESVYSMDGDLAPLQEIASLAELFGAALIVDEAHGAGVIGPDGAGLVPASGLEKRVFARVVTFGKAFGSHGAALLGSSVLREAAVNFCGSFIYTTAASDHHLTTLEEALRFWSEHPGLLERLRENTLEMNRALGISRHESPVYSFQFSDRRVLTDAAAFLRSRGYSLFPVYSPTVRRGTERLRVVLHSFNSKHSVNSLCEVLKKYERYWEKNFCYGH